MKKMFFYAAIATVAFASCSKDKGLELPNNGENETMEAIQFELSNSIEVTTRGTGAVGDTVGGKNWWNGEILNVYMFDKGTLNLAYNETTDAPYFENTEVTAPVTTSSSSASGIASGVASYGALQYYPSTGNFDFYAYHGDDAVVAILSLFDNSLKASVAIDGTQDLMVAKAAMTDAEKAAYINKSNDSEFNRVYSAYSARRNVHPRFTFKHLLSRFVFQAMAMEEGAAGDNGIKITKIEVKAPSVGVMTFASLDENELGVVFGDEKTDSADMYLHPCNDEGIFTSDYALVLDQDVRLGESMLLPAGGSEYIAKISYEQEKGGVTIKDTYVAPIVLKNGEAFQAGYQYKVSIKVYDFKEIKLIADLEPWKKGEDVNLDSEE